MAAVPDLARQSPREILVVDLLGGIGDLVMVLPVIHGLARHHPRAALRVLTHAPGADLLSEDPAVTEVRVPAHGRPGAEREAVMAALADRRPDLVVTTTRYDGIPALLEASGARCVTDLWRCPPPDQQVTRRYLSILRDEGLLDEQDVEMAPRVLLTPAELAEGERVIVRVLSGTATPRSVPPVVAITDAGMRVKRWPEQHWRRLVEILDGRGHAVLGLTRNPFVPALPPGDLRELAARFAAVGRRGGVVVGPDTGPLRIAAAAGAPTLGLFGPTVTGRYGLAGPNPGDERRIDLQGLPDCPHRRPTAITEQVCWWGCDCPLAPDHPACMAALSAEAVARQVLRLLDGDSGGTQWPR